MARDQVPNKERPSDDQPGLQQIWDMQAHAASMGARLSKLQITSDFYKVLCEECHPLKPEDILEGTQIIIDDTLKTEPPQKGETLH